MWEDQVETGTKQTTLEPLKQDSWVGGRKVRGSSRLAAAEKEADRPLSVPCWSWVQVWAHTERAPVSRGDKLLKMLDSLWFLLNRTHIWGAVGMQIGGGDSAPLRRRSWSWSLETKKFTGREEVGCGGGGHDRQRGPLRVQIYCCFQRSQLWFQCPVWYVGFLLESRET